MEKLKIPPEKAKEYARRMMLSLTLGIGQGIQSIEKDMKGAANDMAGGGLNSEGLDNEKSSDED